MFFWPLIMYCAIKTISMFGFSVEYRYNAHLFDPILYSTYQTVQYHESTFLVSIYRFVLTLTYHLCVLAVWICISKLFCKTRVLYRVRWIANNLCPSYTSVSWPDSLAMVKPRNCHVNTANWFLQIELRHVFCPVNFISPNMPNKPNPTTQN